MVVQWQVFTGIARTRGSLMDNLVCLDCASDFSESTGSGACPCCGGNNYYDFINELVGQKLEISGKTYEVREDIKKAGGKWNPEGKTWLIPVYESSTINDFRGILLAEGIVTKVVFNE